MAEITAAQVKELRERTGSGMMECKRALQETGGDIEAAVDNMRKAGQAKADKKASRIAAEGLILLRASEKSAAMVEINCETDFVTKNDDFRAFSAAVADLSLQSSIENLEALLSHPMEGGSTIEEQRRACIAKIGENINVRRVATLRTTDGVLGHYVHGTRIGVLVELQGGDAELAKDIAMHIAASRPLCISEADLPAEDLAREREIYAGQAAEEAKSDEAKGKKPKPAHILEKMVEGKLRKYLESVTLLGQTFIKSEDEQSVGKLLESRKAKALRFVRFELGEGIEKKSDDFVAEVMAQVRT